MRWFKYFKHIWVLLISALVVTACGGGGGGGGGNSDGVPAAATSELCDTLAGTEAVYWDFINGVPRGDLPATAFTIPSNFLVGVYTNSVSPLLGFTAIPDGWMIEDGGDVSGFGFSPATFAAANLTRNDGRAYWRYVLSGQVVGGYTSAGILDAEITEVLNALGNPRVIEEECEINLQQNGTIGPESLAAKVVRTRNFTIMARAHVIIPTGAFTGFYDGYLSLAPTAQNEAEITNTFIPMITQLYGGGDDDNQCEDGRDNDGDGDTDLADGQCESPSDDSESS